MPRYSGLLTSLREYIGVYIESQFRSVVKALSWRVSGTLATAVIVYIFTRQINIALWAGAFEFASKILLYFLHERIWNKVRYGRHHIEPAVIWMTGLSGSGKSTLALALVEKLKAQGLKVEHLDGDTVRDIFPNTGFSKAERDEHIRRVGYLASRLEKNGVFVVASFISPYQESREFVRGLCRNFKEVYLSTPLEICEKRDVKGLYKKAREGVIQHFTGVSDPYEAPARADFTLDTSRMGLEESARKVLRDLEII